MSAYPLTRRRFLQQALAVPALSLGEAHSAQPLVFGLTPVILDDQLDFLRRWRQWLEAHLQSPVRFVQRLKYRDITEGLLNEQIDAAWVCGYPYVRYRPYMQLLAVPRYKGQLTYHSYIITNSKLTEISRLQQLQNRVFAFSDPDSNSGYLYPSYRFLKVGIDPRRFFRRSFFTWSHRNTIDAVASGLADAGAVDSYVWEQFGRHHPEIVKQTHIIERSPAFGFPPLVVRKTLPTARAEQLGDVLLAMQSDPTGQGLLQELGLDGFARGRDDLFAGIEKMWQRINTHPS